MANAKAKEHIRECAMRAFDAMDKDDNGCVTICEFREYCQNVKEMEGVARVFNEVDSSDDFKITLNEVEEFLNKVPQGKIEEGHVIDLFHKTDTSGNGKLDKNEFRCLLCECGYPETTIQNTIDHVSGDDDQVTLEEFLHHWKHDC